MDSGKRKNQFPAKFVDDECSFIWIVDNLTSRAPTVGEKIVSEQYSLNNHKNVKFRLWLYLRGDRESCEDCIGLFLFADPSSTANEWLQVEACFAFVNETKDIIRKEFTVVYKKASTNGFPRFIERQSKIFQNFLQCDQLTIHCSIKATLKIQSSADKGCRKKLCARFSPYYEELFNNSQFCDLTLLINNRPLRVHTALLAAASPVFTSLLINSWKETDNRAIEIKGFLFETVQEMLRYIYTGDVEDLDKTAHELLVIADKYDIKKLKNYCEEELCRQINLDNIWTLLEISDNCQAENLKHDSMKFITENKKEVIERPEFLRISSEKPHLFVDIFKYLSSN